MKIYTIRLHPGQDLKKEIIAFVQKNTIQAGSIVTCVGGLSQARLRMAGATPIKQDIKTYTEELEIVSLVGTVGVEGEHLHMSVSRSDGSVLGGHLKDGSIIDPTAEIVILEIDDKIFKRSFDQATGFSELFIAPKRTKH